jgi:hypothetical protein
MKRLATAKPASLCGAPPPVLTIPLRACILISDDPLPSSFPAQAFQLHITALTILEQKQPISRLAPKFGL